MRKPEEKRPLGRPRHRWYDNIKMGSWRERTGWYGPDSSVSGYVPAKGLCEYGNESSDAVKLWEFLE
jgi:hypothetical protein